MPAARRPSLAATGVTGAVATGPPALGALGSFTVCDKLNCSSFKNVGARVKAVGAHVAIYVDTLAPAPGLDSADLDTLKQEFDSRLYPLDTAAFRSEEHTSELQSQSNLVCRLLREINPNGTLAWISERNAANIRDSVMQELTGRTL